jgi:hypothetical protein
MNRLTRIAAKSPKTASTWRLLWTLVTLGLVALGTAAPGTWDIP